MIPVFTKRVLRLGVINIWRHRLRSFLTVLGIVFGVSSVIAMIAIGEGASYEAQEQIKKLGSQNIIVNSVPPPQAEEISKTETSSISEYGLTYNDAETIRATIPDVEVIVPSKTIRADVTYRRKRLDANVIGTVPLLSSIANKRVAVGRFFNEIETADGKNVCVLGDELARRLFTFENPMGNTVKLRGEYFTVIGIMEEAGPSAAESSKGISLLNLYVPITAAKARFGDVILTRKTGSFNMEKVELHQLIVKVKDIASVTSASEIIRKILERLHTKVDYEIVVPLELLRQAQRTKQIFNIVLGSIAAISLLVGGIGIMNIMLATVTERTREIGIRRALGARRRDIVIQFLIETVLLSSGGGAVGLVLGALLPFLVTRFAGMETIIRLWSLIFAFGISILIGLIFGIYPAYRAAAMNPIMALRHE